MVTTQEIIAQRNQSWEKKPEIPKWVPLEKVGLDQFFTTPSIATHYFQMALSVLASDGIRVEECLFIEPSAGDGSFFQLLPKNSRIGLDLFPLCDGVAQQDFLDWTPPVTDKKIVFIGNPPFGYRAWLALTFMNHAAKFADYVFFILPMSFQSNGKGNPKDRVQGMKLCHSEHVMNNSFFDPAGKCCKINALWQVWKKGVNEKEDFRICAEYVDIFTVDQRKERLCGQTKMQDADFFLQRTYFNTPPSLVKSFSEVKYVCGYGLIIKKDKNTVTRILEKTDWNHYSNLAAHNCRHISMYHIEKALVEGGLRHVL